MLIRERNPKLQTEGRTNLTNQQDNGKHFSQIISLDLYCSTVEVNQYSYLQSYGNTRMSIESNLRRPMNTIVELSPEQTHTSIEDLDFSRDETRTSLSPLAQG